MSGSDDRRVLITGAAGQLGAALVEEYPDARALTRADWDLAEPAPEHRPEIDLVLHAAAWTDVEGAEAALEEARATNVLGTRHVAALGRPVLAFSTDYVFDGTRSRPYVESDSTNPLSVYGRTKLDAEAEILDGWVVRTAWLFGWSGSNFMRTMLRLGADRSEVSVVADQEGSPTYVGHLATAVPEIAELQAGLYHVAASGSCSWADFAEAIFEEAGFSCRVNRITTEEFGAVAPRPAYSVIRSERSGTPTLPHWRDGLSECLARLRS